MPGGYRPSALTFLSVPLSRGNGLAAHFDVQTDGKLVIKRSGVSPITANMAFSLEGLRFRAAD